MNKKYLEKIILGILVIGMWGIMYSVNVLVNAPDIEKAKRLNALLFGVEAAPQLSQSKKEEGCQSREPLPDPECTPGAIFPDATKERICVSGYSKTVRNVSVATKKKVFAWYGIAYPQPFGSYEVDHLIPLALGGSNEMANLWPKSAQYPGFYEKNITGNFLREQVCAGRIALGIAQERIARNWFEIYENLSEDTVEQLKAKYRNWAK